MDMDDGIAAPTLGEPESKYSALNGLIDGAIGLALLFMLAFVCEWRIRRREGRKPPVSP